MNGNIVAASWNADHKDGGTDKVTRSIDGEYGMKAGGASSEWHEQALKDGAYLLETQDPSKMVYNSEKAIQTLYLVFRFILTPLWN